MIYLDNNATTRVDPAVVAAMAPLWTEAFYNPTSPAAVLCGVRRILDLAVEKLAELLQASPTEFTLTSGATEANNWVLHAVTSQRLEDTGRCHILVSEIEHPSVLETVSELSRRDRRIEVELIPVDHSGVLRLEAMNELLRSDTALVSVMLANNESGVIQPVSEVSRLVKQCASKCLFHTDATQAVGKMEINLESLKDIDLLSLSAHKFHGPKGVGALFIRHGTRLRDWMIGGNQQGGRRAGTENPAVAAGLTKAVELLGSERDLQSRAHGTGEMRNRFEAGLRDIFPEGQVLGHLAPRLANTSLVVFPGFDGEMLVHRLLEDGIIVSTGAACSNGSDSPSHVVVSMGVDYSIARGALRISLSNATTIEEIDCLLGSLNAILADS